MLPRFLIAVASLGLLVSPALAQNRPTADQIIAALKPTGQIQAGNRGIRPVAPGAAAVATEVSRPAPAQVRQPSMDLNVHFEFGSAELTPDATRTLDELGRALSSNALGGYRFRIEGHTDTVGTEEFNKTLSDQRAATVARYLEGKFGVGPARLETVGLGQSVPLVATPPQTPEQRNRRVHVVNLGA
ncbi:MAG: OmpA family protein [Alphaproteobacteria bacterium]|nr:OmpA family protein [Alphaproteobacteria bacterium]